MAPAPLGEPPGPGPSSQWRRPSPVSSPGRGGLATGSPQPVSAWPIPEAPGARETQAEHRVRGSPAAPRQRLLQSEPGQRDPRGSAQPPTHQGLRGGGHWLLKGSVPGTTTSAGRAVSCLPAETPPAGGQCQAAWAGQRGPDTRVGGGACARTQPPGGCSLAACPPGILCARATATA